ncbi:MAG TPA: 3-deoxy-7-phosphoheptulonate synthase [Candidatus Acidoferrales bacterium]|nr:3-deoxy-7-phosphoheptulonate synthase [Candidatus Acidoferrales bacterium]
MIGAFEGIDGAHSQLVLDAYFRARELPGQTLGTRTFRDAAMAVSSGRAELGIVPIDNTTTGTVQDGYDLLFEFDLVPVAEISWRMEHRLLGVAGAALRDVREILAHPMVLAECGKFITSLTSARAIPCEDTGVAAREVARRGEAQLAAIAPPSAAAKYGLAELSPNIANHPDNLTRFLIFRARHAKPEVFALDSGGPRKTSLFLATKNISGAMVRCLEPLAQGQMSVTKLESRPQPRVTDRAEFHLDVLGDLLAPEQAQTLARLRDNALEVRVLGSYRADAPVAAQTASLPVFSTTVVRDRRPPPPPPPLQNGSSTPRVMRDARPEGTRIRVGNVEISDDTFTIIGGPCSIESREQIVATACAVRDAGGNMLRGGAFKPRTNPYSFQGMGWDAVDLIAEAGRVSGMPTVSEVMSIDQVEGMARSIDVLQIGTRNMQNFDLLRAVGRAGKPVLLKRGMSATIEELLAAAEYILAEGNPNVMLCERGIRTFETATRNTVDLSAVPVLRERTHLPILVDPSHGVGVRRWIRPMCRAAKAVGAHGIIVEVHPNPPEALSDKEQAMTFEDFADVCRDLARIPLFESEPVAAR